MHIAWVHGAAGNDVLVTQRIQDCIQALAVHGKDIDGVVLCASGSDDQGFLPVKHLPSFVIKEGVVFKPEEVVATMREEARRFLGREPDLWHFVDPFYGLHPRMPEVVATMARMGMPLILEILRMSEHECGKAFQARKSALESQGVYPLRAGILYLVANSEYRKVLLKSGVPDSDIRVLIPPIPIPEPEVDDSGIPWSQYEELVYLPGPCSFKSNLGELMLHAAACPRKRTFATGRGATSCFSDSHQQWMDFARELGLRVNLAVTDAYGIPHGVLADRSVSFLTTSLHTDTPVPYAQSWLHGRALTGRDQPSVTEFFKEVGVEFVGLYSELEVPVSAFRFDEFLFRMQTRMLDYRKRFDLLCDPSEIKLWIDHAVKDRAIDFGWLDEIAQREVVESVYSNLKLQQQFGELLARESASLQVINSNASLIESHFGASSFVARLLGIYVSCVENNAICSSLDFANDRPILEHFLNPTRFCPLLHQNKG